ncbi:rhamnose-binding lectin-like [Ostrea edulis]|uniref:rhamnose-binding lectin-like n=1 Tax=Ostrea edulis TaxID=37623 RepID=UPI002094A91D|nr:rhamnose-binding lectin-like [Ostrea edulis]
MKFSMMLDICLFATMIYLSAEQGPPRLAIEICENEQATIRCGGERILVESARYGQTRGNRCGTEAYGDCERNVTNIVKGLCNNKATCQIQPVQLFADPCPGTVKYAKVVYVCLFWLF